MLIELGNLHCHVLRSAEDELRWLDRVLSFEDKSFQARVHGDGRIHLLTSAGSFPAGLVGAVQRRGVRDGRKVEVVDKCVRGTPPELRPDVGWLRSHQLEALAVARRYSRGVFHHPTGAGKTEVMVGLGEQNPGSWLILVHTKILMDEIRNRFLKRTGEALGMLGDGHRVLNKRITVAMFQTVYKAIVATPRDPAIVEFLKRQQGMMVDEVHVVPASTFWKVTHALPNAYYRYGFSGTPFARSDSKSIYVIAAIGPTIHRVTATELIDKGLLAKPNIRLVPVQHKPPASTKGSPTWQAVYKSAVVCNDARNATLTQIATIADKPTLLFVKALEHGRILEKLIRARGLRVEFVWGEHITPQRWAAIRRLVHGDVDVLICNVIFQVGVDIPELQSVIIGSGGKSAIMVLQNTGRGTRRHAHDGTVTKDEFSVYDIQDRGCGCRGRHAACRWLEKHTKERLAAYAMEQYSVFITRLSEEQRGVRHESH
jgi:superfamily II DNA or RNA helicase